MKRFISLLLVIVISASLITALTIGAGADFGGFSGDADFGGGDDGYSDWDYDDYDDYDDYGIRTFTGSFLPVPAAIIIIVFVVIVYIILTKKGIISNSRVRNNIHVNEAPRMNLALNSMASYRNLDPEFSEETLKEWISNSYVRLQRAWQAKDLSDVQTLLSDAYYAQMDAQLESMRSRHITNVIDKIAVLGVSLSGWRQDAGCDIIVAELRTRIVDYTIDDRTGDVIGGNNSKEKFMIYEWTLSRTSGVKSSSGAGTKAANCPNCGAPIDLNKSAVCPYCDSVIKSATHDWVITTIKAVSQQTV